MLSIQVKFYGGNFLNINKCGEIKCIPEERCVRDISIFIDDMRLIKNIFNEYYIYFNQLESTNIFSDSSFSNKLFALIVYKNTDPKDFSDLIYNKGTLFGFITRKQDYINSEIEIISHRISEKKEKLKEIEDAEDLSELELKQKYINKVFNKMEIKTIYIDGMSYDYESFFGGDEFNEILNSELITNRNGTKEIDIKSDVKIPYEKDLKNIKYKQSLETERLSKEIEAHKNRIDELKTISFKDLIRTIDAIPISENHDILKVMLSNGYDR